MGVRVPVTEEMDKYVRRMELQSSLHRLLQKRSCQPVATNCMGPEVGPDPQIEPFNLTYEPYMDKQVGKTDLYLHTSPEFAMKRLLCRGMKNIYQIAPVFRQGEMGKLHTPEFTMAEWYRSGFDWTGLMDEVEEIVSELLPNTLSFQGRTINLHRPFPRVSVLQAMEKAGVNTTEWEKLQAPDYAEAFYQAYVEKLEPWLEKKDALFLVDFPEPLALLAKLREDKPGLAERFELIIAGVEVANGCTELTDHREHQKRFEADNAIRKKLGKTALPFPQKLYDDIKNLGMPSCAGVALGVDRLAMIATDADNIERVQALPFGG